MVDVNEKSKEHLTTKYRSSMKNFFRDWDVKVMSYVMIVIIMVAMIAATVAWFTHITVVMASGLGMTTASSESIKVEVKQENAVDGFAEVHEGEEDSVLADLDMPVFDNVEMDTTDSVSKLAPGVYGSVTLRLTALRPEVNHYKITPGIAAEYISVDENSQIPEAQIAELLKGHIQFFQSRVAIPSDSNGVVTIDGVDKQVSDYIHSESYVFDDAITDENPMKGVLPWNQAKNIGTPTEITIYWYWPYEYANLSSDMQTNIPLPQKSENGTAQISDASKQYFDWDRMTEMVESSISWDKTQLYDFADTKIGTYVKNMKLQFEVEGYHEEETNETPTSP